MKITQNTPALLVVDDRPWFIGLLLIGFAAVFGALGLGAVISGYFGGLLMMLIAGLAGVAFTFLVERTQLVMDSTAGKLEIRKKSMRRKKVDKRDLKDLRHTTVESQTSHRNGNPKTTSRIVLVFSDDDPDSGTPLTAALTSGGAAERISPVINAWLEAARA